MKTLFFMFIRSIAPFFSIVLKLYWLFKYFPVVFSGCAYLKVNPWKGPQMFPTKLWNMNTVIFSKVFYPASMTLDFLPTLIQSNPPKTKNSKSSKMCITSTTLSNHPSMISINIKIQFSVFQSIVESIESLHRS